MGTIVLKPAALLAFTVLQLSTPCRGLFGQAVHSTAEAADSAVLASLRTNGADLSKPTEHLFYLYFPSEDGARAAASEIAAGQATHNVAFQQGELDGPNDKRSQWMVRLTVTMVLNLAVVRSLGAWLAAVAREHEGEYDGWEAAVTK